jgi:hypothetical protein
MRTKDIITGQIVETRFTTRTWNRTEPATERRGIVLDATLVPAWADGIPVAVEYVDHRSTGPVWRCEFLKPQQIIRPWAEVEQQQADAAAKAKRDAASREADRIARQQAFRAEYGDKVDALTACLGQFAHVRENPWGDAPLTVSFGNLPLGRFVRLMIAAAAAHPALVEQFPRSTQFARPLLAAAAGLPIPDADDVIYSESFEVDEALIAAAEATR